MERNLFSVRFKCFCDLCHVDGTSSRKGHSCWSWMRMATLTLFLLNLPRFAVTLRLVTSTTCESFCYDGFYEVPTWKKRIICILKIHLSVITDWRRHLTHVFSLIFNSVYFRSISRPNIAWNILKNRDITPSPHRSNTIPLMNGIMECHNLKITHRKMSTNNKLHMPTAEWTHLSDFDFCAHKECYSEHVKIWLNLL